MSPFFERPEDIQAMYNAIRCERPAERPSSSHRDVTPPTPPTPPTSSTEPPLNDISNDADYDLISNQKDLGEDYLVYIRNPLALRRRAIPMAEDFSEGRLETFVGSPQKEHAGTQNQYVSYQVTTKVGARTLPRSHTAQHEYLHTSYSPTFSPSRSPSSPSAAASQTSSSYGNSSAKNIRNAPSHPFPTSTRWNTYAETALVRTLHRGAHIHYIAFSSG